MRLSRSTTVRQLAWVLVILAALAAIRVAVWLVTDGFVISPDQASGYEFVGLVTVPLTAFTLALLAAGSGFLIAGLNGDSRAARATALVGLLILPVGFWLAFALPALRPEDFHFFGP